MEATLKRQRQKQNFKLDNLGADESAKYQQRVAACFERGSKDAGRLAAVNKSMQTQWGSRAKSDRLIHSMNEVKPTQVGYAFFHDLISQADDGLSPDDRHAVLMHMTATMVDNLAHCDDNMESVLIELLNAYDRGMDRRQQFQFIKQVSKVLTNPDFKRHQYSEENSPDWTGYKELAFRAAPSMRRNELCNRFTITLNKFFRSVKTEDDSMLLDDLPPRSMQDLATEKVPFRKELAARLAVFHCSALFLVDNVDQRPIRFEKTHTVITQASPHMQANMICRLIPRIDDLDSTDQINAFDDCFKTIEKLPTQYQANALGLFAHQLSVTELRHKQGYQQRIRAYFEQIRALAYNVPSIQQASLLGKLYDAGDLRMEPQMRAEIFDSLWQQALVEPPEVTGSLFETLLNHIRRQPEGAERTRAYEALFDIAKQLPLPHQTHAASLLFQYIGWITDEPTRHSKFMEAVDFIAQTPAGTHSKDTCFPAEAKAKADMLESVITALAWSTQESSRLSAFNKITALIETLPPACRLKPLQAIAHNRDRLNNGPEGAAAAAFDLDHCLSLVDKVPGQQRADLLAGFVTHIKGIAPTNVKMVAVKKFLEAVQALPAEWRAKPLQQVVVDTLWNMNRQGVGAGLGELSQEQFGEIFFDDLLPMVSQIRPMQRAVLLEYLAGSLGKIPYNRQSEALKNILQMATCLPANVRAPILKSLCNKLSATGGEALTCYQTLFSAMSALPKAQQAGVASVLFYKIRELPPGETRHLKFIEACKFIRNTAPEQRRTMLARFAYQVPVQSQDVMLGCWDAYRDLCRLDQNEDEVQEDFFFDHFYQSHFENDIFVDPSRVDFNIQQWAFKILKQQPVPSQTRFMGEVILRATFIESPYMELQFADILKCIEALPDESRTVAFANIDERFNSPDDRLEVGDLGENLVAECTQQKKLPGFFKGYLQTSEILPDAQRLTLLAQLNAALPKYPAELFTEMNAALQEKISMLSLPLRLELTQRIAQLEPRSDDELDQD
jgi:hypothetical protein